MFEKLKKWREKIKIFLLVKKFYIDILEYLNLAYFLNLHSDVSYLP